MKKHLLLLLLILFYLPGFSQAPKTELYDLVKKLMYDSTGYENVGDWGVGQPKKYPVNWKSDRIEMSDDTSINFFRTGTVDITIKGKSISTAATGNKWNIMLKGPRMGYTSFSIISPPSTDWQPKQTIDSLFGNKPFKAKLLKYCDDKSLMGYYYYEVKIPKKDIAYIKISWITVNGKTAVRVDVYDSWSKYAVKFDCR